MQTAVLFLYNSSVTRSNYKVIPQLTIGHYDQWKKERRVTAILPNGVSKHGSGIHNKVLHNKP
jgi:hypothetical protein